MIIVHRPGLSQIKKFLYLCPLLTAPFLQAGTTQQQSAMMNPVINKDGSFSFELVLPQGGVKKIQLNAPAPVPEQALKNYKSAGVLPYFSIESAGEITLFVVLYSPIKGGSYSDIGAKKSADETMPVDTAVRCFMPKQLKLWKTAAGLAADLDNINPFSIGGGHYMYLLEVPAKKNLVMGENTIVVPLMNLITTVKTAQKSGKFTDVRITDTDGKQYLLLEKFIRGLASSPDHVNKLRAILLSEKASGTKQILQQLISGE